MNYLVNIWLVAAKTGVVVEAKDKKEAVDKAGALLQQGEVKFLQTNNPQEGVVFLPHELTDAEFEDVKVEEVKADIIVPEEKKLIIPGE